MNKIKEFCKLNKKGIIRLLILAVIAIILELTVFNFSSWKTLGTETMEISTEAITDDEGHYRSDWIELNDCIKNIFVEDVVLFNCDRADVQITLTDEGDEYEYDMPVFQVTPGIPQAGFSNIYPYGKVTGLSVHISVPEGGAAVAGKIYLNYHRPIDIKPLRLLLAWLLMAILLAMWNDRAFINLSLSDEGSPESDGLPMLSKTSVYQKLIIVLAVVGLILFGRWLSRTNQNILSCPWPHHKQYQELAVALDNGTVELTDKVVDPLLLEKDNPYDTIALAAESIFYNMDYAYFNGAYYVYFGIIPELLLYYPHYKLMGTPLNNYDAQFAFFAILVVGVFLTLWKLSHRYGTRDGKCRIPFLVYMLLSIATVLFSNNIYMIARADIYNIPVMAATAFTWLGIGLWLSALDEAGKKARTVLIALGSLSMAMTVGCRPQFALYSFVAIFLFLFVEKSRRLFTKDTIAETLAFCIPYILVAIIVCWYNQARFGSIFDFGATYSLTTNDMNHRGFNFNRLFRGLFAFFFQPANLTMDFPYLKSSVVISDYMGRNLTEFIYGGCFVTNLLLFSVFAPVFGCWKRLSNEVKAIFTSLVVSSIIIAAFDVNGAGILYRYTCDFIPGMLLAAIIIWICLFATAGDLASADTSGVQTISHTIVLRLFALAILIGLSYSFLVFLGTGDSVNLRDNSPILYEQIRAYFRV